MCGARTKKTQITSPIGADPGKKDASATPFLPAEWRIRTVPIIWIRIRIQAITDSVQGKSSKFDLKKR